jgi:ABC-2 type transport system permease protein
MPGLRAEWTKTRTLRTNALLAIVLVAGTLLLTVLWCSGTSTQGGGPPCLPRFGDEDVVRNSLGGIYLGQIAVVAFATLAITSEYATRTISATFIGVPRRERVVLAKAVVLTGIVLVAGLAVSTGAFLVGQPLLHGNGFTCANGYPLVSLTDASAFRAVTGTALYLLAVALLSLGVGALFRHTAAAITTTLGLLYIPTIVSVLLPASVAHHVEQIAPMTAGLAVQQTVARTDNVPLAPWAGLTIAFAWALLALAAGTLSVRLRDA